MKRNVTIAAITAAVLIGGGAAGAAAFADSDDDRDRAPATSAGSVGPADDKDADEAPDDRGDDRATAAKNVRVSLDRAVAAALKSAPGTVTGAELDADDDDHEGRTVWELDVRGSDGKWHDVAVDATSGKVLKTREDDDDRDRHAPRSSAVTLDRAAAAALKTAPGTITSIDLDDDDDGDRRGGVLRWDVDIEGKDGKQHELRVDAGNGKVTVDRDDDGDDRDGDDD